MHGYEALVRWVDLRNSLFPHDPDSVQVLALARAREAGHVNLLAYVDDEPVGVAMIGDDPGTRASTHAYVEVGIVPSFRGRGIGTALFRDVSLRVLTRSKEGLECEALASDARSLEWLARRGFQELRRYPEHTLEAGDPLVDAPLPDGVAVHAVGSRPDLLHGMYEVARAAYPELPSPLSGQAGTYTEWQVYELGSGALDLDLSLVAEQDGAVQGYSTMTAPAGSEDAAHRMVHVALEAAPGLAAALVREQVVRARDARRRRVVAWATTPAVATVYAGLGFRAGDESVMLRGPLL